MSPYYLLLNYVVLLITWGTAYLIWQKAVKHANTLQRNVDLLTIVYLAFPMYNIESSNNVYALWVVGVHTLLNCPEWVVLFVVPWIFFRSIVWYEAWRENI